MRELNRHLFFQSITPSSTVLLHFTIKNPVGYLVPIFIAFIIMCPSISLAEIINYQYDDAGRLIRAEYPNSDSLIQYGYDAVGNPVTKNISPMGPGFNVTVSLAGSGTGTVTSSPARINCGTACTSSFSEGFVLVASPDPGSAFAGWSGACSGIGNCNVFPTSDLNVTATFMPMPVIQSFNPAVFFIGATTPISITGRNLSNVHAITSDNSFVSINALNVTDTAITAVASVSQQAVSGPVSLKLTTSFGSVDISASLVSSKLSFNPSQLAILTGGSANLTATINPPLNTPVTIQLSNSDASIVSVPSSFTIPSNGIAAIPINALKEGIAYISSGGVISAILVTNSGFTPISGEQLTNYAGPISVYIDTPAGNTYQQSQPFSVYIDLPVGVSTTATNPVSVYLDLQLDNTYQQSQPFSVYVDSPDGNSMTVSQPVSGKITP